jgi:hypothetical protein
MKRDSTVLSGYLQALSSFSALIASNSIFLLPEAARSAATSPVGKRCPRVDFASVQMWTSQNMYICERLKRKKEKRKKRRRRPRMDIAEVYVWTLSKGPSNPYEPQKRSWFFIFIIIIF